MDKDPNPFLSPEFQAIQRQYLDALSAFYPVQPPAKPSYTDPQAWNDALEYWWKSVQGNLGDKNKPVMDAVLNQSKIFYAITDQFATLMKEIGAAGGGSGDWEHILDRNLDNMKKMFDHYAKEGTNSATAPSFMWTQPVENWKSVMSGVGVFSDDMLETMMEQGTKAFTEKLLSIPAIGMSGDFQEKLQKTIRLWNEYQLNSNRYRQKFTELGKQAVDKLREDILAKAGKNEKISSLKEIYNMWINANEEVFASYVFKEDYAKLYGDLVNSLVEFKKHSNSLSEDMLKLINVPSSAGVNTMAMRQHLMKNQLRMSMEMQQQTMDTLEQMRAELQELRKQVSAKAKPGSKAQVSDGGKKKARKHKRKSAKS